VSREISFGRKDVADKYREEFPDSICSDDDARLKTVTFASSAPDWLIKQAGLEAMESRGEDAAGAGQVGLTDHERDEIDFSKDRASVPHARAVKAIAHDKGVDDWLAYYDPTITVEEHYGVMKQARSEGGGRRMDENRTAERRRDAARTAQDSQCDHTRGHCEHGEPAACEFLRNACDYTEEEIEEILVEDQDNADEGEREIEGKAAGAVQRAWDGYKASIAQLDEAANDYLRPEWANAQQAARAINAIRREHGQDPIHFERLEEIQADLLDLARMMAADCVECHADHGGHNHAVGTDDREDVRKFVGEGADETPVGVSEDTATAITNTPDS
jgi:hypothetical protein